jgi:hypothetical protein
VAPGALVLPVFAAAFFITRLQYRPVGMFVKRFRNFFFEF